MTEHVKRAYLDMIQFYQHKMHDIEHTIKVHSYARMIALCENVDEKTLECIELSAIAHDLSCPYCEEKYGCSAGYYQQIEAEPITRQFYEAYHLDHDMLERIVYNVNHHHTYHNVDGIDLQILLEADFLVNANESEKYHRNIQTFYEDIFKTKTGKKLLVDMYPVNQSNQI